MRIKCDLNIITEFMKFDIHKYYKRIITSDCIAIVL